MGDLGKAEMFYILDIVTLFQGTPEIPPRFFLDHNDNLCSPLGWSSAIHLQNSPSNALTLLEGFRFVF